MKIFVPKNNPIWIGCFLLTLLAGCESNPFPPEVEDASTQAPIERTHSEEANNTSLPNSQRENPAANTLLAQAEQASQQEEHGTAIVYLERAIRLDPRNPKLWINLSQAYLNNQEVSNAKQHARKPTHRQPAPTALFQGLAPR